jgi:glycosyltransferase involved in cell wall biosynthesis
MARVLTEAGWNVDAISHDDRDYQPTADCVGFIDLHSNRERLISAGPRAARKILHATGAHWEFQNRAELARLQAIASRRGFAPPPRRQVPPSRGIELADLATTTGNAFTIETFGFAKKPIHRVPLSSTYIQDWPVAKNFATTRARFLWFGSHGLVHKGLDLVLEAFAQTPELQLTIAGPVAAEPDFASVYARELALPNVRCLDWIDTRSAAFAELLETHGAIAYPSASEGGGGSVITCLHGGLLPIVTREASVDVGDFGHELRDADVATLVAAVRATAAIPRRVCRPQPRRMGVCPPTPHARQFRARLSAARRREVPASNDCLTNVLALSQGLVFSFSDWLVSPAVVTKFFRPPAKTRVNWSDSFAHSRHQAGWNWRLCARHAVCPRPAARSASSASHLGRKPCCSEPRRNLSLRESRAGLRRPNQGPQRLATAPSMARAPARASRTAAAAPRPGGNPALGRGRL